MNLSTPIEWRSFQRLGRDPARWVVAAVAAAALAACGGSREPEPVAPPLAQPVAQAAADAYTVAWNGVHRLAVLDNDTVREGTAAISVTTEPANGSVTVKEGEVTYTPRAGFYGADSFTYQLDVDNANNNSARGSAVVTLVVQAQITLQGAVTDGPIGNASVVANVGEQVFTATADAQGRYSLAIKTSTPSDFVMLTATGAGAQSKVVLTSLVGEVSGLAAASKDGVITSDVMPALMVTHLSAAQAGLMARAGVLPNSNAQMLVAAQRLDSLAVLDAAALVKLVVDAGVALPTGVASTRELLNSATLLTAFDAARRVADAAQLAGVRGTILADPTLTALPPQPSAGPVSLLYAYGVGGLTKPVRSVVLRPDGTATVVGDSLRPGQWRLEGKLVKITFDSPQVTSGLVNAGDSSGVQFTREYVTTGVTLSDVGASNGRYTLAAVGITAHSLDRGGAQVGVRQDTSGVSLMRRYETQSAPLNAADFATGDRWAGLLSERLSEPGGVVNFKQDVLRIAAAGTGTMERKGVDVTWQVSGGALLVQIGNEGYRYRRLDTGPLGEERWLVEQLDATGQAFTVSELMAVRATDVVIDTAGWAQRWLGNLNAGATRSDAFYTLKPDATWAISSKEPGVAEPSAVFSRQWRRLADGRLELVSVSPSGCNPWVGTANCRITSQRFWTVLAQQGKTIYVMETGPGSATSPITSWRFVAFTEVAPLVP